MGSGVVRVDVMKGDQRIAGVTVRPGSRALSNAALIAAAPDMREALERIGWHELTALEARDIARAALASIQQPTEGGETS